jgi:NTE family protein
MNEPLPKERLAIERGLISSGGYRFGALQGKGLDSTVVLATFSGGGKRSSAFSYGLLKGMRDYELQLDGQRTTLLDQIDLISSVSGGTFTAAYYGLHRDKIFTDYERDFLRVDINAYLYGTYLLPWEWQWMVDPYYGTNDRMEKVYDQLMFCGATYADLEKRGRPVIQINATNIALGSLFSFNQNYFDRICSDLTPFPLARAVAASNGFPVLFGPITLTNHRANCGDRTFAPVDRALEEPIVDGLPTRRRYIAQQLAAYRDPERIRYLHLMDGGIGDNLAMRAVVDALVLLGSSPDPRMVTSLTFRARRILLIVGDGQAAADESWSRDRTVSSLVQVMSAVSGTQIDRYNFETLQLAEREMERITATLRRLRCAQAAVIDGYRCDDVVGDVIHFSLSQVADEAVRKRLEAIPTGLSLDDADVDALIAAGETAIRTSPQLARFRRQLAEKSAR